MILTCPQCTTRFLLPATVLADEGRNVKCSNCGEVWYEEPDYDELAELQDGDESSEVAGAPAQEFDDIPDGVKPDIELDFVDREEEPEELPPVDLKTRIASYAAAACVFFVVLGLLLVVKSPMVRAWPASAALYQIMGMKIAVPGEGLVFDHVTVESAGKTEGGENIIISGQVINLTNEDQTLPAIEANLRHADGEIMETWIIDVPAKVVPAEADLKFMQNYHAAHDDANELFLRFALNGKAKKKAEPKTASKAVDNTHAQSSDDHAPQSAHEEVPESHAPASAAHH